MEGKKYPILRLIIPMIIGMIGAFLCYDITGYCALYTTPLLIVLTIGAIACHIKGKTITFGVLVSLIFFTFGFTLANRSMQKEYAQYGKNWKYELYKHSLFECKKALEVQESLHQTYKKHELSKEEGSVIEAMTIGWRQGLSKETKEAFSRAGLSHTLALSGFHITIVFIILHYLFLGKVISYRWRFISNFLTIIALWAYAFIAGMQPSLIRATMMCTLLVLSQLFGQKTLSLNSCLLTAAIMLICEPLMMLHIGFLLSFSAVIGICIIGIPLCKKFTIGNTRKSITQPLIKRYGTSIFNYTKDIIIISLVCNIFTIPIVAYTFHQIPLLSIISNLLSTLLVSLIIIISAIWWSTLWCTPFCNIVYTILNFLSSALCDIAHYLSDLPYSVYYSKPNIMECILMYGIIGTASLLIHKNTTKRMVAFLLSIITFCIIAIISLLTQL